MHADARLPTTPDALDAVPTSGCPVSAARRLLAPARASAVRTAGPAALVGMLRSPLRGLVAARGLAPVVVWPLGGPGGGIVQLNDLGEIADLLKAETRKSRVVRRLGGLLGDGLITSDGERWRQRRRSSASAFTGAAVAELEPAMRRISADIAASLPAGPVDLNPVCLRLTLRVAAATLFGQDTDDDTAEVDAAVRTLTAGFEADTNSWRRLLPEALRAGARAREQDAVRRLDRAVYARIARRRQEPAGPDLLWRLMHPRDGEAPSDAALRDDLVTLFVASHETTATTLAYALRLLADRPDLAEALARPEGDREALSAVVRETLRLYPAGFAFGRELTAPRVFGGRTFPEGTQVIVSPWAIHRDPTLWADPDRFLPERWATATDAHKLAWMPFSAGPRACIGARFATAELEIAVAELTRRWRVLPAGPIPEPRPGVTLRPGGEVRVRLEARR